MPQRKNKPFKILSLDGGGVRGVFAAKILQLTEQEFGMNLHTEFDLIVGTSTGSIAAAAVATKYDIRKLVAEYEQHSKNIFNPRFSNCPKIVHKVLNSFFSKYRSEPLERFLHERLKDIMLGEMKKPLIINATNVTENKVHVFKSSYQEKLREKGDYSRDPNVPLYRAVLASCSAPTYFDPVKIDGKLLCDGGVWANNPSLVGYTDAIRNFKVDSRNIRLLSLGTGYTKPSEYTEPRHWGLLCGWRAKIVELVMSCQTSLPNNVLELAGIEHVRINPPIDYCALDDYGKIPYMVCQAEHTFEECKEEIKLLLTT